MKRKQVSNNKSLLAVIETAHKSGRWLFISEIAELASITLARANYGVARLIDAGTKFPADLEWEIRDRINEKTGRWGRQLRVTKYQRPTNKKFVVAVDTRPKQEREELEQQRRAKQFDQIWPMRRQA